MRVIDLTLPLYTGMPVYPGDPEASIERIQTIEREGWNLTRLKINSHDGTHVNVPSHMVETGKSLDDIALENFFGPAQLYESPKDIEPGCGVIFHSKNIPFDIAEEIAACPPKFIGLSADHEFNIDVERYLLEHGVVTFENLANTGDLPKHFFFCGVPLKIRGGDGSPVRAFAIQTDIAGEVWQAG
jgi:arylformamidase